MSGAYPGGGNGPYPSASGGGGSGGITIGTGSPTGTPPTDPAIYLQGPGPNYGVWVGTAGSWDSIPIITQGP